MLTNDQVFALISKKNKVESEYDKQVESHMKKTYKVPTDDEIICQLANQAFANVLKINVDANISEVYNIFSIISRN